MCCEPEQTSKNFDFALLQYILCYVDSGAFLEQVPRVPGTRRILNSYAVAPLKYWEISKKSCLAPVEFLGHVLWHPWVEIPNQNPVVK